MADWFTYGSTTVCEGDTDLLCFGGSGGDANVDDADPADSEAEDDAEYY